VKTQQFVIGAVSLLWAVHPREVLGADKVVQVANLDVSKISQTIERPRTTGSGSASATDHSENPARPAQPQGCGDAPFICNYAWEKQIFYCSDFTRDPRIDRSSESDPKGQAGEHTNESLKEVQFAERWRIHRNTVGPHSPLGYKPAMAAARPGEVG
jgi:hypothetical protein